MKKFKHFPLVVKEATDVCDVEYLKELQEIAKTSLGLNTMRLNPLTLARFITAIRGLLSQDIDNYGLSNEHLMYAFIKHARWREYEVKSYRGESKYPVLDRGVALLLNGATDVIDGIQTGRVIEDNKIVSTRKISNALKSELAKVSYVSVLKALNDSDIDNWIPGLSWREFNYEDIANYGDAARELSAALNRDYDIKVMGEEFTISHADIIVAMGVLRELVYPWQGSPAKTPNTRDVTSSNRTKVKSLIWLLTRIDFDAYRSMIDKSPKGDSALKEVEAYLSKARAYRALERAPRCLKTLVNRRAYLLRVQVCYFTLSRSISSAIKSWVTDNIEGGKVRRALPQERQQYDIEFYIEREGHKPVACSVKTGKGANLTSIKKRNKARPYPDLYIVTARTAPVWKPDSDRVTLRDVKYYDANEVSNLPKDKIVYPKSLKFYFSK